MAEPRDRYSAVSLALHWAIAVLALGQIGLIMVHDAVEGGPWMMLHKSGGLLILTLTLARLGWRAANPAIPLPETTPRWQRLAARTTHVLFYVVLLAMPLAGWAASSSVGRDILFYGLFEWPLLPLPESRQTARALMGAHELAAKLLYLLIALHLAGALKHHVVDRDNVLRRMLPFLPPRP